MIRRRLGIRWVVVACLLVVLCGGVAIGADTTAEQTDVVTEGGDVVEVQSLASDPRDGETAEYALTYYIGDDISELTVTVTEASVATGNGFTEVGDNTYEWDGETEQPVLEVEKEVDQTAGQHDGLDFAGTDDWALVGAVSTEAQFAGTGDLTFDRTIEHEFEGVAGDEMAYVGPYDSETVSTDLGDVTVVTAEEATPSLSNEEISEILEETVDQFRITEPRDSLQAYIVTDPIRGGGLATGGNADFWVHEESLDLPRTTLWHEYIHSQQNFQPESDVSWTIEAEADYYAYLLAMKQGYIEYHDFYAALDGADEDHADAILAEPGTWSGQTDYELGALTLAALDQEIREASDGTDTYRDVMQTKNEEGGDAVMGEGSVNDAELESFVSDAARTDMSEFFDASIRSEPESLSVPGPATYEIADTDSELAIDITDTVIGAGTEGTVEFSIANTGDGASIVPFVELSVPDEFEGGELRVAPDGVSSDVTAVDDGWALDHLEPGETAVVEYVFDAPEDESAAPEDIDALVTDRGGESAATSSELEVVEAPDVSFDIPDVITAGESVTFDASNDGADQDIATYTWEITGPEEETTETDEPALTHEFSEHGEYSVVLTVATTDGATATVAEEVLVNDEPSVAIDAPEEVSPGDAFLAEVDVTNEFGSYDVEWEANGLEASAEQVEFEFTTEGERELSVTVTDEHGESATETTTIVVGDPDGTDGLAEEIEDAFGPGFGAPVAVLAFVGLLFLMRIRR